MHLPKKPVQGPYNGLCGKFRLSVSCGVRCIVTTPHPTYSQRRHIKILVGAAVNLHPVAPVHLNSTQVSHANV
jgi:hypothetical protein